MKTTKDKNTVVPGLVGVSGNFVFAADAVPR